MKLVRKSVIVGLIACSSVGCRSIQLGAPNSMICEGGEPGGNLVVRLDSDVKIDMLWVPPGSYMMGQFTGGESGELCHLVTISKGFWIGKTEVTQKQWKMVMGENPSVVKGEDYPVENISWYDCQRFIKALNRRVSKGAFRLPTEAEWEYCCRAGSTEKFCFGDNADVLKDYANYNGVTHMYSPVNGGELAHSAPVKVASYKPNRWGLYDMHGNVYEWCQDKYGDYPFDTWAANCQIPTRTVIDPAGVRFSKYRVLRGGCFALDAFSSRSAARGFDFPNNRSDICGLRICWSLLN